jgi:hypothetical protein
MRRKTRKKRIFSEEALPEGEEVAPRVPARNRSPL